MQAKYRQPVCQLWFQVSNLGFGGRVSQMILRLIRRTEAAPTFSGPCGLENVGAASGREDGMEMI